MKYSAVSKTPETSFENVLSATPQDQQCLYETQCTTTPSAVNNYMTSGTSNSSTQNTSDVAQKQLALLQHQPKTLTHNIKLELYTDEINSPQHLLPDPCMIQLKTIVENTEKHPTEITSNLSVPKTGNISMRGTKRSRGKESKNSKKCTMPNLNNEEKVKSLKKTQEEKNGKSVLTQYPKRIKKEPFMSRKEKKTPEVTKVIPIHTNLKKMLQNQQDNYQQEKNWEIISKPPKSNQSKMKERIGFTFFKASVNG